MLPFIFYIGTIAAAGLALTSQLTSGPPKQGGGDRSKRHTRKNTKKLGNSRKRR
jgi:hypothetical protein